MAFVTVCVAAHSDIYGPVRMGGYVHVRRGDDFRHCSLLLTAPKSVIRPCDAARCKSRISVFRDKKDSTMLQIKMQSNFSLLLSHLSDLYFASDLSICEADLAIPLLVSRRNVSFHRQMISLLRIAAFVHPIVYTPRDAAFAIVLMFLRAILPSHVCLPIWAAPPIWLSDNLE